MLEDEDGTYGDSIPDDTLEERFEHASGLLVDHGTDTLDAATTGQSSDGWFSDALDVVTKNLSVSFGSAFA